MAKRINIIVLFVLILTKVVWAQEQTLVNKLEELQFFYHENTCFKVLFKHDYFADRKMLRAEETLTGMLVKIKGNYYYQLGKNKIIQNNKYMIWIDEEEERIMINKFNGKKSGQSQVDVLLQLQLLDSLMEKGAIKVTYQKLPGGKEKYTVRYRNGDIEKAEYIFKGKYLKEVIVYYLYDLFEINTKEKKPVLRTIIWDYTVDEENIDKQKYLKVEDVMYEKSGTYVLKNRFKKYKLINQEIR